MSDCEPPACYRYVLRTARRPHVCCECGGRIEAGEQYHYHSGVWDGEASDHKVCLDCEALRKVCDEDAMHDEQTGLGELAETVCAVKRDRPEIAEQFAAIRRKRGVAATEGAR